MTLQRIAIDAGPDHLELHLPARRGEQRDRVDEQVLPLGRRETADAQDAERRAWSLRAAGRNSDRRRAGNRAWPIARRVASQLAAAMQISRKTVDSIGLLAGGSGDAVEVDGSLGIVLGPRGAARRERIARLAAAVGTSLG